MTSSRACLFAAVVLALALLCASAVMAHRIADDDDDIDAMFDGDNDSNVSGLMSLRRHSNRNPWSTSSSDMRTRRHSWASMMRARARVLSTQNLTTVLMRALDTKNTLLLMLLTDSNTAIVYNSDLADGGIYKGRRGLLELYEACAKGVRVTNSSFNIVSVDEDRNTATVVRTVTGVARRTNVTFTARKMFVIKFALQRIACLSIVDLDYDTLVSALSSPAEKALSRLGEECFTHGPLGGRTQALLADNVSVVFGAVWPKTLFSIRGKDNLSKAVRSNKKTDAVKLLECLFNHTESSLVLHADERRVVTVNFAGNVLKARKYVDRHSDGTVLHGLATFHPHAHGAALAVYYNLHEFDSDGKLTRMFVQLTRPLTLLDRMHLRDVHHITIHGGGDHSQDSS